MVVTVRAANVSDHQFLESMFVEAALWDPGMARQTLASLLRVPQLRPYFVDWGRPSDVALIASAAADRSVGAAWYRFFSPQEPGFGFVDQSIPELGIAIVKEWRGRSIGTTLLKELISTARTRGCSGLSLSVSAANPARRLYQRCGFSKVGEAGSSWTMLARLL
jgi:GNAT superfamily N-acetyltransferase